MIRKVCILSAALILLWACDPLDTGDPPTLSSYDATFVTPTQIQLSWQPSSVSDDLIENYNLHFKIWVAKKDDGLDEENLGSADFTTEEGALSFNLVGLEEETDYEVLVRASDRANDTSTNSKKSVTATTTGKTFGSQSITTLNFQPTKIICGRVLGALDDLGLVDATSVRIYRRDSTGTFSFADRQVIPGSAVRDAVLVPVQSGVSLDDLFVLTDNGLIHYRNGTNLVAQATSFDAVPVAESFHYRLNSNGVLDHFSYVGEDRVGYVYQVNEDDDDGTDPFNGYAYNLQETDTLFRTGDFNEDGNFDMVIFRDGRLLVDLASENDQAVFEGQDELDQLTATDVGDDAFSNSNSVAPRLFVLDGDNDGNEDIYVFVRNESEDLTKMFFYQGKGDGSFEDATEIDYDWRFYEKPIFADAGGDEHPDFIVPQTSSNNVAIYFGPSSGTYKGTPSFYGIDGTPSQAISANLDGANGPDLVVYSSESRTINALYAQ